MTRLRKMMLEELERRNYSEATTGCYIRTVRRRSFPPLNLHRPASTATTGGHIQTALPDARRAPRLRSLLAENAHPVKR